MSATHYLTIFGVLPSREVRRRTKSTQKKELIWCELELGDPVSDRKS